MWDDLTYRTVALKIVYLLQAFFMCNFSYSGAGIDNISTDIVCRAVPLR